MIIQLITIKKFSLELHNIMNLVPVLHQHKDLQFIDKVPGNVFCDSYQDNLKHNWCQTHL